MILYVYCAGAFGKEVMDVARRVNSVSGRWREVKFIDDVVAERFKYNAEVVRLNDLLAGDCLVNAEFVIANGEPMARKKIAESLERHNAKMGRLIDDSSIVVESARIEEGVVVTPFCSISSSSVLSSNCCINTMSIIGHDVCIGRNSVVSSMVNMGGASVLGENSYIGMGALIKDGVKIGSNSIIGMGSVVYGDIPDGVIALGNPARVARHNTEQRVFK
jgi:sugar O-acyltransferase (sialic acid O-acetyltransferase NeuD family)